MLLTSQPSPRQSSLILQLSRLPSRKHKRAGSGHTLNAVHQCLVPIFVPAVPASLDILHCHATIEFGFFLVAEVAEPIPLARHLGVEGPDIVVDDAGRLLEEFLVEELALEET